MVYANSLFTHAEKATSKVGLKCNRSKVTVLQGVLDHLFIKDIEFPLLESANIRTTIYIIIKTSSVLIYIPEMQI